MSESGLVEVPDGQIFYTRDGAGPPLLLIHGGLVDHRMFDDQVSQLSLNHTLIRIDLRGYGRSSMPPPASYRHCDDVAAVLDALGFDRAVVGGSSFGGAVSLDFAFAHPDRAAGLVFSSATIFAGWDWQEEQPVKQIFEAARAGGTSAARQAMLGAPLMASTMRHPKAAAAITEMVNDYSGWHLENRDSAQWAEPDAVARLHKVDAPTLVVVGAHDVLDHRLMAETLADRLPATTGHMWPISGHMPNMEEPDAFNELVNDFLDTVDALGAG